jgi:hypothetical protein
MKASPLSLKVNWDYQRTVIARTVISISQNSGDSFDLSRIILGEPVSMLSLPAFSIGSTLK